jgi:polysaccharide deacetylase family protein (PEP-CTERM system associated)
MDNKAGWLKMINFFTVDLEFWHSWSYLKPFIKGKPEDQLVESTNPLLKLLDKHETKATFFTLGEVAEKYPEYIRQISEKGHEIACHGYSHTTLAELGKERFAGELKKATKLLKKAAKNKIIGFRAPSFSLTQKTGWLITLLQAAEYRYDSSIFPIKMHIKGIADAVYGISGAPKNPYYINSELEQGGKILEFPIVSYCRIPVAGGFYHRLMPAALTSALIRKLNRKGVAANFWIHSQETYAQTPRIKQLPRASTLIRYYNIRNALRKTEQLLKRFRFGSIASQLENYTK